MLIGWIIGAVLGVLIAFALPNGLPGGRPSLLERSPRSIVVTLDAAGIAVTTVGVLALVSIAGSWWWLALLPVPSGLLYAAALLQAFASTARTPVPAGMALSVPRDRELDRARALTFWATVALVVAGTVVLSVGALVVLETMLEFMLWDFD